MNTKALHRRVKTKYGERLNHGASEKQRIANKVVEEILYSDGFDPRNPVFVSDGSSATYVFYAYMAKYLKKPKEDLLNVWTNNLDVPIQVLCENGAPEKISIEVAPGHFMAKYCGTFGESTEAWIEKHCDGTTCIMAVTGLDPLYGPYATSREAKRLKAAIMRTAKQLVIIADSTKLQQRRDNDAAVSPNEWVRWKTERKGRLFVVVSRSSNNRKWGQRYVLDADKVDGRKPDEIEVENHVQFELALGKSHFLVA